MAPTRKRVAAYFMHEDEEACAHNTLADIETSAAYLIGVTDDAGIAKMRDAGLIVEELETVPKRTTRAGRRSVGLAEAASRRGARVALPKPSSYPTLIEIDVTGPLTGERRDKIAATGATIIERQVNRTLLLAVENETQLSGLGKLAFVGKLALRDPEPTSGTSRRTRSGETRRGRTRRSSTRRGLATAADASSESEGAESAESEQASVHDVLLRQGTNVQEVRQWLEQQPGAMVIADSQRKLRVLVSPTLARQLARQPGVELVSEVRPRHLKNDVARGLTKATDVRIQGPSGNLTLTGEGEIVAVADSGIDESHPDFKNRIVKVEALGRTGDASDFHGHGTHVAGTILGDGKASNKKLRGVAPNAKLYFQSLMDEHGGLGGLPIDLSDLFEKPYDKGARIHNNSWGAALYGRFNVDSLEVDRFIAEHPDMLIVIAAGNEGSLLPSDAYPHQTPPDEVELLSINTPATSKNALVVGASRSTRKRGGLARYTYQDAWPDDFSESSGVSIEKVSGNADSLAGFSSRGPSDDDRIKPDLVAPGTDILSTRSKDAPSSNFWGTYRAHDGKYAYMGGTSMATPHVSGCAALVRQYYRRKRRLETPSSALLKATLINGCRWLTGADASAAPTGEPNFHQGFGAVDLSRTLPRSDSDFRLAYVDTWLDDQLEIDIDQRHRWQFELTDKQDLRICFAYTDYPARSLQNVLYIMVEEPAGGSAKQFGNARAPKGVLTSGPDTKNNVEVVRIRDAEPGTYLVQVAAHTVLHPPQHYALAIAGALDKIGGAPPPNSAYSQDLLERRF